MSVSLTNNFWLNSRGLTYGDSASVTWSFNKSTNTLSATVISAIPAGANPSAKVGLAAVNGTATTFMRSDGAPALDQAIAPTWTGLHTFNGGVTIGSVSLTLNGHTLTLTGNASVTGANTGDQAIPAAANPSGLIGMSAVNGVASTFERSDSRHAIDPAIVPTWTGVHTFSPSASASPSRALNSLNSGGGIDDEITRAASTANTVGAGPNTAWQDSGGGTFSLIQHAGGQTELWQFNGSWVQVYKVLTSHGVQFSGPIGINGVTPPSQSTGWGTPTGGSVQNNFSGSAASLLTLGPAVAQIIAILKANGLIGA